MKKEIVFGLFSLLLIVFVIAETTNGFDVEDPNTWPEDVDAFINNLNSDSDLKNINNKWASLGGSDRQLVLERLMKKVNPEIKIGGFDNNNELMWKEGMKLSDGNKVLNLREIPAEVSKVEYSSREDNLVYEFGDGGKIEIGVGEIIEEEGKIRYMNIERKYGKEDIVFLDAKGNEIIISDEDTFIIKGVGEIEINGNSYVGEKGDEKVGIINRIGKKSVEIEKLNVNTRIGEIDIGSRKTQIIYDGEIKKPETGQYIMIGEDERDKEKYLINFRGKSMFIDIKGELIMDKTISLIGEGDNVLVKNGENYFEIDGKKINYYRKYQGEFLQKPFDPLENIKQKIDIVNIRNPDFKGIVDTYEKIGVSDKSILESKDKRVCIGSFCLVANLWNGLEQRIIGYDYASESSTGDFLISKTQIFAGEKQVDDFVKLAKENKWTDSEIEFAASTYFTNVRSEVTLKRKITFDQFEGGLKSELDKLALDKVEKGLIEQFRLNKFKDKKGKINTETFPTGKVLPETKTILINYNTGSGLSSLGIFSLKILNGVTLTHRINGESFKKAQERNFLIKDKSGMNYNINDLIKLINKK
ncbi:hypothetical protein CMI42_05095 [Candidatus Pacearchaeota archaeon]|nr:hypothetical protein [Candidatus Pacearchaeota archaeon]